MALSKKQKRFILKNYARLSLKELARETGADPGEVRAFLESSGLKTEQKPAPAWFARSARPSRLGMMAVIAVISVVYLNSYRNGFHYDDIHSLLQNFGVRVDPYRNPESLNLFWRYFVEPELFSSRPKVGMPRPLLMITFGLNYMTGTILCDKFSIGCEKRGYDPRGWILVNILLHLANCLIVYVALCRLTGRKRLALFIALLFAVHPINTETVNYINCRSESLVSFFMLLSLYYMARALRDEERKARILGFLFFILGLLTKELAFVTPALVFAVDLLFIHPLNKDRLPPRQRFLRYYLPLLVIMFFYLGYRRLVLDYTFVEKPVRSVADNLVTQVRVLLTYLRLLFLPFNQNISYENVVYTVQGFIRKPKETLTILSCLSVLLLLAGLAVFWYRKRPVISFAIANFFIVLSVTSSVIPLNAIMNEHRLYLPSLSACILLAGLGEQAAKFLKSRSGMNRAAWPVPVQAAGLAMLFMFSTLTVMRNFTWHTDLTVWRDSIRNSPKKAQVVSDLGNAYYRGGRALLSNGEIGRDGWIDKREQLLIAQMFYRNVPEGKITPEVQELLKELYVKALNRAEQLYQWAIRVEWSYYKAWHNLGTINYTYSTLDLEKGDQQAARRHLNTAYNYFRQAAAIYKNGESFNDGASALMALKRLEEDPEKKKEILRLAEINYRKAISYNPELQKAYINLAMVLDELGRTEEALPILDQGIRVNPVNPAPHILKGKFLLKMQRYPEALSAFQGCLRVDPGNRQCEQLARELKTAIENQGSSPPGPR